ncbi:MAG: molybdenum cofactor guanylyltransferase [Clostridiales Family XIII bacterium]|jgi:molybdopterin-guanine dinucleotide biosynthesis protein A|nr:molybdenum cofactor guanylyltransferase [Clostridiales Family XIII bacterium]
MKHAAAVILAGGRSSRMGTNKAFLRLNGKTFIEIMLEKVTAYEEIFISSNEPDLYAFIGIPVVPDRANGLGPMEGIRASLEAADFDYVSFLPCDAPLIPRGLAETILERAKGHDAALPVFGGRKEPLLACYRKTLIPLLEEMEAAGIRKAGAVFQRCDTAVVDLAALTRTFGDPKDYLINANDPETFQSLANIPPD